MQHDFLLNVKFNFCYLEPRSVPSKSKPEVNRVLKGVSTPIISKVFLQQYFESKKHTLKVLLHSLLSKKILGLSKEIPCILTAQVAAKLGQVKVEDVKKILLQDKRFSFNIFLVTCKEIFFRTFNFDLLLFATP